MWKKILGLNFTSFEKLSEFLELDPSNQKKILKKSDFVLNLPVRLAEKIEKNNLQDPILRQFIPLIDELEEREGFDDNPVGDCESQTTSKLLQKYWGRSLILTTSACAMHCRFCFRKEFGHSKESGYEQELEIIRHDETITEILLSGGDPLSLSDRSLGNLLEELDKIPHVARVRFHTRFILGIPERVDASFLQVLNKFTRTKIFAVHVNHPKELDAEVCLSLETLRRENILLFSQTVLLRGVNDDVETLSELFLKLIHTGVVPYYLHQLDRVRGAHHFEVSIEEGKALIAELQKRLPGYAIPTYVQEIAKMPHKIVL